MKMITAGALYTLGETEGIQTLFVVCVNEISLSHTHTYRTARPEVGKHAVEREPLFLSLLKNQTSSAKEFDLLSTHVHVLG